MKSIVINGEPAAAMLGVDFDKAVAELNIAPRVILLRLNRRCEDRIEREIQLTGALTNEQRAKLMEIADKCPVHQTLTSEINIRTRAV